MKEAETKYNTLVQKGEWKVLSKREEHLFALVAATKAGHTPPLVDSPQAS
jgi:hypothetical protein